MTGLYIFGNAGLIEFVNCQTARQVACGLRFWILCYIRYSELLSFRIQAGIRPLERNLGMKVRTRSKCSMIDGWRY